MENIFTTYIAKVTQAKLLKTYFTSLLLLLFLMGSGVAFGQTNVSLINTYSCAQVGQGETVIEISGNGFLTGTGNQVQVRLNGSQINSNLVQRVSTSLIRVTVQAIYYSQSGQITVEAANRVQGNYNWQNAGVITVIAAPTATPANRCGTGTVTLNAAGGTAGNYRWYTTPTGGTAISGATSATYTTPSISTTTTYYVSVVNGTCESTRTAVTATVNPLPAAPVILSNERCGPGLLPLTVQNPNPSYTYFWYDGEDNLIYTSPNPAASASYTPDLDESAVYYVSAVSNGCQSTRTAVTATIKPLPEASFTYNPSSPQCQNLNGETVFALLGELNFATNPTWEVISGPGVLEFDSENPFTPNLVASPGTIRVRFSGESPNGCGIASQELDLVVTPRIFPIAEVLATDSLAAGTTVTLTANSNIRDNNDDIGYQWYYRVGSGVWNTIGVEQNTNVIEFTVPENLTSLRVDIRVDSDACYGSLTQFNIFEYEVQDITALPVEIIYLNANTRANEVVVRWATASEEDNAGFDVEVSTDGKTYRKLAFVETKNGNASTKQEYQFVDKEDGKFGTRYYRLRQIDTNGTTAYFGPTAVEIGEAVYKVAAYPNPFKDNVELDIVAESAGTVEVMVVDAMGKVIWQEQVQVQKGFNSERLELKTDLPRGIYIVRTAMGNRTNQFKLLKQ